MVANSFISVNIDLWKKKKKSAFFLSMIDNIIHVSIALTYISNFKGILKFGRIGALVNFIIQKLEFYKLLRFWPWYLKCQYEKQTLIRKYVSLQPYHSCCYSSCCWNTYFCSNFIWTKRWRNCSYAFLLDFKYMQPRLDWGKLQMNTDRNILDKSY